MDSYLLELEVAVIAVLVLAAIGLYCVGKWVFHALEAWLARNPFNLHKLAFYTALLCALVFIIGWQYRQ